MILLNDIRSLEEIREVLFKNGTAENEVDEMIKAAFKPLYSREEIEKYRGDGVQEMGLSEFLAGKQKMESLDVTFFEKILENDLGKIDIDGKTSPSDALHSKISVVIAIINFINQTKAYEEQESRLNALKRHEVKKGATLASIEVIDGNISLQLEAGKINAFINEMVNLIAQLISYNDKGKFTLYDYRENELVKSILPYQKNEGKKPGIEYVSDFQRISKEIKDLRNAQTAHFNASIRTKTLNINMSYLKQLLAAFDEIM